MTSAALIRLTLSALAPACADRNATNWKELQAAFVVYAEAQLAQPKAVP